MLLSCCRELKDTVQAGSLSPECALVNAALVSDLLVLHAAAYKALAAAQRGELRTRSLHAELVFSLSGSKHVSGRGMAGVCLHLAARLDWFGAQHARSSEACTPQSAAAGRAVAALAVALHDLSWEFCHLLKLGMHADSRDAQSVRHQPGLQASTLFIASTPCCLVCRRAAGLCLFTCLFMLGSLSAWPAHYDRYERVPCSSCESHTVAMLPILSLLARAGGAV